MLLSDIMKFNHKIKKIDITNLNSGSLYRSITIKINLFTKDSEIIRFSKNKDSEFFVHQKKDNDYFIRIPNNLNSITTIYAHFFPKDLYNYIETQQVFSDYDLSNLFEEEDSTNFLYQEKLYDGKPYIQSTFLNKEIKNPNYKNYTSSNIEKEISDMTEQGRFPLSSRYRPPYQYLNQPNVPGEIEWGGDTYSSPTWEKRIPREHLSPLISDGVENTNEDIPINVYLNYQYLPTSTEYHQHYYGFEEEDLSNQKNFYNILEGEKLNEVNSKFGSSNNYRIIQLGDVFDDSNSFFINKQNIIPIDLEKGITKSHNDIWKKNKCENYFIYSEQKDEGYVKKNISLNKGNLYSLKYFIYIPGSVIMSQNSCFISINNKSINDNFKQQDNLLRNQWIYHEVPFIGENINTIEIIGPKFYNFNNDIYFTNIYIEEMMEYSPLIKYNMKGVYLQEQNKSIRKKHTGEDVKINPITEATNSYLSKNNSLPIPHGQIMFYLNDNVYYDDLTGSLFYSQNNRYQITFDLPEDEKRTCLKLIKNIEDKNTIYFTYNEETGDLFFTYEDSINLTRGPGNSITIKVKDSYNNIITKGEVHAEITDFNDLDLKSTIKDCGTNDIDSDGTVSFYNINLKNTQQNKQYYLMIQYSDFCNDDIIDFKPIIISDIDVILNYKINGELSPNLYSIIEQGQLPCEIDLLLQDQNGNPIIDGYSELSINDKMIQSTLVDSSRGKYGICDFYLDIDDFKKGQIQTVKLEYFNKFYKPVKFISFEMAVANILMPPTIPIRIDKYNLNDSSIIQVKHDDILIFNTILNENQNYNYNIDIFRKENKNKILLDSFVLKRNNLSQEVLCFYDINGAIGEELICVFTVPENETYRENKEEIIIKLI